MLPNEKKLVILVDDNIANLRTGINILSKDYIVSTALSAEKLFSLLENEKPALILLDIDMPEMNGYEAIKILKSGSDTKNIPVIFLTAKNSEEDEIMGLSLGAIDFITKPFSPSRLLKRIEIHLLLEHQRRIMEKQTAELNDYANNLQIMVFQKMENIMNLQDALLRTMAEMVECRDHNTGGHIERTQRGVQILIKGIEKNGLFREETSNWDLNLLLQSCQLHDVGKISISDNILKKPGKLDDDEFNEMKKHTTYGKDIIEKIEALAKESDFLGYAKIFAVSHHEKWNGTGYPCGLKGNEIPLLGRIMAIADVYDALVSDRPYKKAFSHEEAVRIITEGGGTQFDPVLIDVFQETADQFR